jgi:molecular chaperone DnaK
LPADKKGPIETALAELKEAHKNQNFAGIDAATERLNSAWTAASEEMYKATQQSGGEQAGPQGGQQDGGDGNPPQNDSEVTDVDFEEVK